MENHPLYIRQFNAKQLDVFTQFHFLTIFYIRVWIRLFNAYFSRNALYYWTIQFELRQFQDGTTQSGIHPAPDSLFIGVRVSYLHGVLNPHLHDLRNNSRHSFFMAQ